MSRLTTSADYGVDYLTGSNRIVERILAPRHAGFATFGSHRRSQVYWHDDFLVDTINLDMWALSKDTNATNFAANAANNGTLRGVAATTDGEGVSIAGFNVWSANQNCGMEVRMKLSYVTNGIFEVGFADTATDFKDPIVNDIDTPTATNGAGDWVAVVRDTAQTLTTAALVGKTSAAGTTTKTNIGTWAPTAAQYFTVRIQTIAGTDATAVATIWDGNGGDPTLIGQYTLTSALAGATKVRPYINVTRKTADNNVDIDYITLWQDRA